MRGIHDPSVWGRDYQVPERLLEAVGRLPRLELEASVVSPTDGFQKLRFKTHDGLAVETVVIPLHKAGTASVCLSSQVGCVMGCKFCATARMPRRRNLETWEMIDQFVQAHRRPADPAGASAGAVFMGMGEPFLNYNAVLDAAELLHALMAVRSRPRPSPSAPSGWSPRSIVSRPRGTSSGWRSAWRRHRRQAGRARSPGGSHARGPGDGCSAGGMLWLGATASCWLMCASRA